MDNQKKGSGKARPAGRFGPPQQGKRPPGKKGAPARSGTSPQRTGHSGQSRGTPSAASGKGQKRPAGRTSAPPPKTKTSRVSSLPKKGEAPSLEDRTNQARKMQSRQEARDQNGRRHKRRRKASTRFYSILVVLFAVAIGVTLCMTVCFNIQTIQVQGETRYETEEIIRASGLAKGKNLLLADIKGGEEDLTVKLPYIGSAHIVRQLPATVIIEVEENTPAYAVQMEGGWAVADENGKTLEYLQGQVPSVPVVVGISVTGAPPGYPMEFEDEEQKNKLTDLTKALKENNLIEKTTQMDFTNSSDITVLYDNRITLKCGGAVDLDAKLAMAQEAIARKAPDEQKATIVLTSTQATVRFGDASSGSSSQPSSSPPEEDASAGDEGGSSPESESKRTGENSTLSSVD